MKTVKSETYHSTEKNILNTIDGVSNGVSLRRYFSELDLQKMYDSMIPCRAIEHDLKKIYGDNLRSEYNS